MMKLVTLGTGAGNSLRCRANASNLIICGGRYYLIDAGEPVKALIRDRGIPYRSISRIFISHNHQDHIGGLPGFMNCYYRPPVDDCKLTVYLPEIQAETAIRAMMDVFHRPVPEGKFECIEIKPGVVFDDGNLKVTAIRTNHFKMSGFPSYAFLLEHEDSRLVITGDLQSGSFADFPRCAFDKPAWCLCEGTHGPDNESILNQVYEQVKDLPVKQLIFTHYNGSFLTKDKELFIQKTSLWPFPVIIAGDDDEFDVL